ncbi:hypothetical protein [Kitasatospora sp. NPDC059800]|uniref:hypothetical protein n=1 Tax=Kitasatospora sp. NPDC059800 TaxID=3346951 RepID=UPI00365E1FD5
MTTRLARPKRASTMSEMEFQSTGFMTFQDLAVELEVGSPSSTTDFVVSTE